MDTSSPNQQEDRSFIGFYVDPVVKEHVQRQAEQEGTSLSEWMRQRLDAAAEKQVATA